jgi:hypothetical protein
MRYYAVLVAWFLSQVIVATSSRSQHPVALFTMLVIALFLMQAFNNSGIVIPIRTIQTYQRVSSLSFSTADDGTESVQPKEVLTL